MKKGPSKQQKKERYNKVATFLSLICYILMCLFFVFPAVENWLALKNPGGKFVKEYSGVYDLSIKNSTEIGIT